VHRHTVSPVSRAVHYKGVCALHTLDFLFRHATHALSMRVRLDLLPFAGLLVVLLSVGGTSCVSALLAAARIGRLDIVATAHASRACRQGKVI
jgi:cell division protein FtsW (lipid II flippase)